MFRALYALTAVVIGLAAFVVNAAAEPVFMPGMRIGLEPPGDLKLSTNFPGFEDADRKVSIVIIDLPAGAIENIERSAFSENQRGLTGLKREAFPFTNGIGVLISGQAKEESVTVNRWFLIAKTTVGNSQSLAMLVNVGVPESARAIYSDAVIRKALTSVALRETPIDEQLGMMPFKIGELAGFRVMQALPEGAVILTDGPTEDLSRQPYVIVSIGRGKPEDINERGKFARELLTTAPLRNFSEVSGEQMRIGGAPGYELRAKASGLQGEPVTLVQWVRFGTGGFLRIVGVGRAEGWDDLFTRFRAVRDGVDMR